MMNKLSIESINAKTPYQVKFKQETSSYLFTSESNIDYAVDFTSDDLVQTDKAYQFVIANLNNRNHHAISLSKKQLLPSLKSFSKRTILPY